MEKQTDISIIMLACDINQQLSDYSKSALESIRYSAPEAELIIIDNASDIGSGFLKSHADIYIRNKCNIGYPSAVNQGFKLAKGNFIAVANNDIKVSPNWINVATEIFKDPKVGSVHFRMIPYDEPIILGGETWPNGKERWCHASFYVIRKEAIPKDMYFEGYKEGGMDDWDFFHRVRHVNGWKTAYTNKAVFQHADSSTYMALDTRDGNRSERDRNNAEIFKSRFGRYAEDIWNEKYPEQMKERWKPFP